MKFSDSILLLTDDSVRKFPFYFDEKAMAMIAEGSG
jgi:hypothetical protein